MDIAVVSAGVSLSLDAKGVVKEARVVLGAVAATFQRISPRSIVGTKLDDPALAKLAAVAEKACKPIDDKRGTIEFRTEVAGVLVRRAAKIAYARAGG